MLDIGTVTIPMLIFGKQKTQVRTLCLITSSQPSRSTLTRLAVGFGRWESPYLTPSRRTYAN